MNDINRFEEKFSALMDKYLSVVNDTLNSFQKQRDISIENYSFNLSHKIMNNILENYNFKMDISIISDGLNADLKKVIANYNTKYEKEIINYTNIEDIFMNDEYTDKDKCVENLNYLGNLKENYLMENNFVNNLNETFTKRIMTRILNTKPNITKEESNKLINEIYVNVKDESFGFLNNINEAYVKCNNDILAVSRKLSEAMAQMELLRPFIKSQNETELEYTTRISRLKKQMSLEMEYDGVDNE